MITLKYADNHQGALLDEFQSLVAQLNAVLKLTADGQIQLSTIGTTGEGGAVSFIKSVQHGTITLGAGVSSATASITPVTPAKAALHFLGVSGTNAGQSGYVRIALTSGTLVTATRQDTTAEAIVSFCVVGFV